MRGRMRRHCFLRLKLIFFSCFRHRLSDEKNRSPSPKLFLISSPLPPGTNALVPAGPNERISSTHFIVAAEQQLLSDNRFLFYLVRLILWSL